MDFIFWLDDIFKEQVPMHFDLYYSKILDWVINIYIKQVDEKDNIIVFYGQETDINLLFAKAEVAVKEYLIETRGGY